jgi:hypothetical protein
LKAKKDRFDKTGLSKQQQKKVRVLLRIKRDQRKENVKKLKVNIADMFKTDRELVIMTQNFTSVHHNRYIPFRSFMRYGIQHSPTTSSANGINQKNSSIKHL